MTFRYKDLSGTNQRGDIWLVRDGNPMEMVVDANGWTFHTIVGRYEAGHYICIPNWSIGSELAALDDCRWNAERLRENSSMSGENANVIASALAWAYKKFDEYWMKPWGG